MVIGLLVVGTVAAVVTTRYVGAERTFYFWDQAAYQDATMRTALVLREMGSLADATRFATTVAASTGADYSLLHTLATAPAVLLFGESRLAYVTTLACVYLVPFVLAVALLAATLVPGRRTPTFWAGAFATLALPPTWLPTLQGYPDTGAAALYVFAIVVYLNALRPLRWQSAALIGLLLALAMIFRRHFIYAALAFLAAIAIDAALDVRAASRRGTAEAATALRRGTIELVAVGAAVLVVLAVLAWPFLAHSLRTDFARYGSWEQPAIANWRWYRDAFGTPLFLLGPLGLAVGLAAHMVAARPGRFLLVLALVSTAQWMLLVRQIGVHYTLHFTPWIALGVVAAGWTTWRRGSRRLRLALLGGLVSYLGLNVTAALTPSDALAPALRDVVAAARARSLLAAHTPPVTRPDRDAIAALLGDLRRVAAPADPIYVAASSWTLSGDLLWHAERALAGNVLDRSAAAFDEARDLTILRWTPFADSASSYPLETLLQARVVVLPSSFQGHLAAGEQDVVGVVDTLFADDWPFAHDFTRLPERFTLRDGVTVSIARRDRPTSLATALATLDAMHAYLGDRPGGQANWLALNATPGCHLRQRSRGRVRLRCDRAAGRRAFLFLDPPPNAGELVGRIDLGNPGCDPVTLILAAVDERGATIASARPLARAPHDRELTIGLPAGAAGSRLLLTIETTSRPTAAACPIVIDDLVVRSFGE